MISLLTLQLLLSLPSNDCRLEPQLHTQISNQIRKRQMRYQMSSGRFKGRRTTGRTNTLWEYLIHHKRRQGKTNNISLRHSQEQTNRQEEQENHLHNLIHQ
ncbi:hypothetical protein H5410_047288 [Solanum commersonii]|uniref:Secreted protein n=1 Tax=Solanum commersonii TaxID=4109 RepID=A0A9J5XI74_SOLCO|nr:hypothetical protein H5410_047288 [Solanum commersonii]